MIRTAVAPAAFDPEKYRQATRAQWETAAEAWDRWAPLLARWLGPATEAMLDMALEQAALGKVETKDGFVGPCEMLVGAGTK